MGMSGITLQGVRLQVDLKGECGGNKTQSGLGDEASDACSDWKGWSLKGGYWEPS